MQYINPPIIVRLPERNGGLYPAAHLCVNEICITTNNAVFIKYINLKPFIIYKSTHYFMFSKFLPSLLPLGGDTPFYAFGNEIKDFFLTRKKTGRRYERR